MKNATLPRVIAGFPGVGKTELFKNQSGRVRFVDSDSSKFSKKPDGSVNPEFPANYITHIKSLLEGTDANHYLLVSTHQAVREALREEGVPYLLVYPQASAKSEYLDRYHVRGNDEKFLAKVGENFDTFIRDLDDDPGLKYAMRPGQYLSDVLHELGVLP